MPRGCSGGTHAFGLCCGLGYLNVMLSLCPVSVFGESLRSDGIGRGRGSVLSVPGVVGGGGWRGGSEVIGDPE